MKQITNIISENTENHIYNSITLRLASESDAKNIHAIMLQVAGSLTDKSVFVCDDLSFVRQHISKQGFTVVACNTENNIIASLIVRYPKMSADNLGFDIGITGNDLLHVAHIESVVVLPAYRGMRLHRQMLTFAESLIPTDNYHYLLTTVSPDNPASYLSFEACGYVPVTTKEKYGGLKRRLYQKCCLTTKNI